MTRDEVAGEIIRLVLINEGGVADVGDGKGVTSFGQTTDWCAQFGLVIPLTRSEAATNYLKWIYLTLLIEACDAFDALAFGVVDFAVHSGHPRAIRALQAAIGVRPDGVIGVVTIEALGRIDRRVAAARLIADRADFIFGLIADQPSRAKFARGWGHRLSAQIRGLGA